MESPDSPGHSSRCRSWLRTHTLSSRAIEWPRPPEAVYLLARWGAYRAPVAVCTTSVATTLATTASPAVVGGHREAVDIEVVEDLAPARLVERNVGAGGKRVATGTYSLAATVTGTTVKFE
jgi:hypothetical protein